MGRRVWVPVVTGPLAPYATGFSSWLASRGYSCSAAADRLYQFDQLSGWLACEGLGAGELTGEQAERFAQDRRARGVVSWASPRSVALPLEYLRQLGAVPPPAPACPVGRLEELLAIDAHDVRLRLGRVPIQLPEPVATLARAVVAHRKGHATIGTIAPSPWLFPGGQPGRPISSARLTQRLANLGIRPNQTRSTALFQLATEIPAAILARTLGIHTNVAVTWQRLSGGDWASYAAQISQRTTPTTGGIPRV